MRVWITSVKNIRISATSCRLAVLLKTIFICYQTIYMSMFLFGLCFCGPLLHMFPCLKMMLNLILLLLWTSHGHLMWSSKCSFLFHEFVLFSLNYSIIQWWFWSTVSFGLIVYSFGLILQLLLEHQFFTLFANVSVNYQSHLVC